MHMAGMGTAMLKGLMQKKNVASMDQLYDVAAQLAVKIYVCEMSMDLMGFKKEEMIDYPGLEVCGVATMLAHAKESAIQFFI
jgi:peroxiredoxin family protein